MIHASLWSNYLGSADSWWVDRLPPACIDRKCESPRKIYARTVAARFIQFGSGEAGTVEKRICHRDVRDLRHYASLVEGRLYLNRSFIVAQSEFAVRHPYGVAGGNQERNGSPVFDPRCAHRKPFG